MDINYYLYFCSSNDENRIKWKCAEGHSHRSYDDRPSGVGGHRDIRTGGDTDADNATSIAWPLLWGLILLKVWMMLIITLYAVAFFIFHSKTYGMVHMACWLTVPLLAMYNGERGRCRWLGKFFYYYYPAHMALIGLLARTV